MMKHLLLLLALFGIFSAANAEETSRYTFVSEFIRELSAVENVHTVSLKEAQAKGANPLVDGIRFSTRMKLELNRSIGVLEQMRLNPPFQTLTATLIDLHKQKIELHQQLIDMSTKLLSGPKSNMDYGMIVANSTQTTASLEFVDKTLLQASLLVFMSLVDSKPDSKGHVNHLVITRSQRKQLMQQITTLFGTKINKPQQTYVVSAAGLVMDALRKDYKSSDDPW